MTAHMALCSMFRLFYYKNSVPPGFAWLQKLSVFLYYIKHVLYFVVCFIFVVRLCFILCRQ